MKSKFYVLNVTEDEYISLLESGLGNKLFTGFPANLNVYKSLLTVEEAKFELYKAVMHFNKHTNGDPEDIINALLSLDIDINNVQNNYREGLISQNDIIDLLNDIELNGDME